MQKLDRTLLCDGTTAGRIALDVFAKNVYKKLVFRDKNKVLTAFARFFRELVAQHSFQPDDEDLRAIMVAAHGNEWVFYSPSDGSGARTTPERALAGLYAHFMTRIGRSECMRFYREFRRCKGNLRAERSRLRFIEQQSLRIAGKKWREQMNQSMGSNENFSAERKAGFRIHRHNTPEAGRALAFLLPDPDLAFAKGRPLSDRGSGCSSAQIVIDDTLYFLKRYDCRGWGYRIKNVFRRSRALRVWKATWGFVARELPVPQPLLFLEERRFRLLGRAYILSEFRHGTERLMTLWPRLTDDEKDRILVKSAMLLGRTHRFNCIHGDTNWDNLLVIDRNRLDLLMVDLDCSRITFWCLRRTRALRDVQHFVRDLCRERNDGWGKRSFFLACWQRWFWRG